LAPSTLHGYLSSLSQCFERLLPDLGSWDGLLQRGNPVRSLLVNCSLEAYARSCSASGIMERSAVLLTAAKLRTLLFCSDEELCGSLPNQQRWLVARDAAFFACLWASCRRGIDILRLTWRQLFASLPLLPLVEFWASAGPAQMVLPPGILAVPAQTTTELSQRPRTIHLPTAAPDEAVVCSVQCLHSLYLLKVDPVSHSVSLDAPVFHATSGAPLSTASALNRLRLWLRKFSLYSGETVHSFRRGAPQDTFAQGISRADLMARTGIQTPAVLDRYLDLARHVVP
jgi:integrase